MDPSLRLGFVDVLRLLIFFFIISKIRVYVVMILFSHVVSQTYTNCVALCRPLILFHDSI